MFVCALAILAGAPAARAPRAGPDSAPRVLGGEPLAYVLPYHVQAAPFRADLAMTVLNLLNETRVAAGLVPLMPHDTLQRVAEAYGEDLFARGTLTHTSLDGKTPRDRIVGAGVRVRIVGENLAYADDVTAAHDALMASAPHRANILYPAYRFVGVAVLDGGSDGVIVVEDFTDDSVSHPLQKWWTDRATVAVTPP